MSENPDLYTTTLVVEVVVQHYGTPKDAINVIDCSLKCPAVQSVTVKSGETNYRLWNTPADTPYEFDPKDPFDINTSRR